MQRSAVGFVQDLLTAWSIFPWSSGSTYDLRIPLRVVINLRPLRVCEDFLMRVRVIDIATTFNYPSPDGLNTTYPFRYRVAARLEVHLRSKATTSGFAL